MNPKIFLLILLHEIVGAAEQIFFKKSVNSFRRRNPQNIRDYLLFFKEAFTTPLIWCGFLMTVLTWFIWLMVLATLKLSVAIPFSSIHYLFIFLAAYFILKERIESKRIFGALLILLGILLVAVP